MYSAKLHHCPLSCAYLPHVIPVTAGVHKHEAPMSYKPSRERIARSGMLRSAWWSLSTDGTLQRSVFPFESGRGHTVQERQYNLAQYLQACRYGGDTKSAAYECIYCTKLTHYNTKEVKTAEKEDMWRRLAAPVHCKTTIAGMQL